MSWLRRKARREDGAAAVESALVLSFLLLIAYGIVESSFLMVNALAVGNSTREGARAAVVVGAQSGGDDVVIDIVEQALCSMVSGDATKVLLFAPDANGRVPGHPTDGTDPTYTVFDNTKVRVFTPAGTVACSDGNTVPNFAYSVGNWDFSARDNQLPGLDDIGVLVLYDHDSLTEFLPFTDRQNLNESTVMRLEPELVN